MQGQVSYQQLKQVGFLFHPACPAAEAVSGSYMLSTGVTFRDTHGSLFQDLDGRTAFLTALQKHSNRCPFAANMLPAAIPCPLPTEKKDSRSWFSKRSFHHLAFYRTLQLGCNTKIVYHRTHVLLNLLGAKPQAGFSPLYPTARSRWVLRGIS